jgi:hypothetical protein
MRFYLTYIAYKFVVYGDFILVVKFTFGNLSGMKQILCCHNVNKGTESNSWFIGAGWVKRYNWKLT